MNNRICNNFLRLGPRLFFLPLALLGLIAAFMFRQDGWSVEGCIRIQRDSFHALNHSLGQYPSVQCNLTQMGDAMVFLSFLTIFFVYAPRLWESLIPALVVSLLFSSVLKKLFAIPRPAAVFDNDGFFIIGRKLTGSNSFPSGHSITIFTILTVLVFAFSPQKAKPRFGWFALFVLVGSMLAITRVGVGAHYPIDVAVGCIIGYISGLSGIFISRRYKLSNWLYNERYYPFLIVLLLSCGIVAINKILDENLVIYYLSFIGLTISLYKTSTVYVNCIKKK